MHRVAAAKLRTLFHKGTVGGPASGREGVHVTPIRSNTRGGSTTTEIEAPPRRRREFDASGPAGRELEEAQVRELLCQALETEVGGIKIYETAIRCAQNRGLKEEWEKYLEETRNHERILTRVFAAFSIDPDLETPGRKVVRQNGQALVEAMELVLRDAEPAAAQVAAAPRASRRRDRSPWDGRGRKRRFRRAAASVGPPGRGVGSAARGRESHRRSRGTRRWNLNRPPGPREMGSRMTKT